MDELSPYDRATVNLWRRNYLALTEQPEHRQLAEAAMHAVLAGLRRWQDSHTLFAAYDSDTAADFTLVRSLLSPGIREEMLWRVREAAFYLRWLEITEHAG
jgi:hypothetical protein